MFSFFSVMKLGVVFLFSFLIIWQTLHTAQSLAVMSVDLGSEWMKIAIVSVSTDNLQEYVLHNNIKRSDAVICQYIKF